MRTAECCAWAVAASLLVAACGGATEGSSSSGAPGTSSSGGASSGGGGSSGTQSSGAVPPPEPGPCPCPMPDPWSQAASGCGNFSVHAPSTSKRKFVVVDAKREALGLAKVGDTVTVDLAGDAKGTQVHVDYFATPPKEAPYCTDIGSNDPDPTRVDVRQGKVTFTLSALGREGDTYTVDVTLDGLALRDAFGVPEQIPTVTYRGVVVGWFAG